MRVHAPATATAAQLPFGTSCYNYATNMGRVGLWEEAISQFGEDSTMRISRAFAGFCGVALLLSGYAVAQSSKDGKTASHPQIGKPAPDFELKGIDGKTYKLADYKDKVVVLEWFNQDCPVSRSYTSKMKELAAKYGESGVVWLAIDSTHYQTAQKDAEYHKKHEMPYPILMDSDGRVGHLYGAKTTPHMFVIDKGKLVYMGAIDDRYERNYVADALTAVRAGKEVPLAETKPFGCSVKYKK